MDPHKTLMHTRAAAAGRPLHAFSTEQAYLAGVALAVAAKGSSVHATYILPPPMCVHTQLLLLLLLLLLSMCC
jgi:hypothetical protein